MSDQIVLRTGEYINVARGAFVKQLLCYAGMVNKDVFSIAVSILGPSALNLYFSIDDKVITINKNNSTVIKVEKGKIILERS